MVNISWLVKFVVQIFWYFLQINRVQKLSPVINFCFSGREMEKVTFVNLCLAFRQIEGEKKSFYLLLLNCLQLKPYAKVAYFEVACHKPLHYLKYEINVLSWKALVTYVQLLEIRTVHSLTLNFELCILGFQMFSEFYSQIVFQNLYMF